MIGNNVAPFINTSESYGENRVNQIRHVVSHIETVVDVTADVPLYMPAISSVTGLRTTLGTVNLLLLPALI